MFKILDGRDSFYQWDLDRKLIVNDNTIQQVHFCNKTDDCSLVCEVYEEDGLRLVNVPNILLQTDWRINVYGYDENYTKYNACFNVIKRTKPADYVYTETEVWTWEHFNDKLDALGEHLEEIEDNLKTAIVVDDISEMTNIYTKYALSTDEYYVYRHNGETATIYNDVPMTVSGVLAITDYLPINTTDEHGIFVGFQSGWESYGTGLFQGNANEFIALYDGNKKKIADWYGTHLSGHFETRIINGVEYQGPVLDYVRSENHTLAGAEYIEVRVAGNTGAFKLNPHNLIIDALLQWERDVPEWQYIPPFVPVMASETEAGLIKIWTSVNEDGIVELHIDTSSEV